MINVVDTVLQWLKDAGLTTGFTTQKHQWIEDSKDKGTMKYLIVRNNGGSDIVFDNGGDYFILVDIVGGKDGRVELMQRVNDIISYVVDNSTEPCPLALFNMGGFPAPVFTEDNRMVIRLQLRAVYGQ